jgi:hypothetical protein
MRREQAPAPASTLSASRRPVGEQRRRRHEQARPLLRPGLDAEPLGSEPRRRFSHGAIPDQSGSAAAASSSFATRAPASIRIACAKLRPSAAAACSTRRRSSSVRRSLEASPPPTAHVRASPSGSRRAARSRAERLAVERKSMRSPELSAPSPDGPGSHGGGDPGRRAGPRARGENRPRRLPPESWHAINT